MNPKGKLFSDSFVHIDEKDTVYLDVPTNYLPNVTKMLSMSMFGRKVELSVAEAMKVYGIIGKVEDGLPCFPDSRYKKGHVFRSYLETAPSSSPQLTSLFKSYELIHGVWSAYVLSMNHQRSDDGLKNQVAAHLNLDQLNGVSTKKGCYVGQETYTAYMHHHPHPTRLVSVLLTNHFHNAMTSLNAEQVCNDLPATHILQPIEGVQTGSEVAETVSGKSQTVGTLLYVQPKWNVGLVLCNEFEGVKGPWSVGPMQCLPIL
ncbi:hypothetical protein WA588_001126 [Blastocystis sp. NMH]